MMPGMDGLQVCHTLKNDPATQDTPVVLLSAKAQSHDIELGMRVGADDYITKPPDLLDLVTRVPGPVPGRARNNPQAKLDNLTVKFSV